ncbi:hypothetical protein NQ016_04125 [Staphylococcus hyicus]|uniref:hypothetical protein n=1 Tax=Staphylococcus hyicus TaxID=1284 RepID=UPI00211CEF94|nr:hypothetical protein [Staphylococcus hyicus]MCQ9290706.1 hypothetical protein [Staphylococcus hyicus]MCQ9305948.1 hypothetical protein [Staphylococcus hyicus]MCQ9308360.1 hypothetical protein [Staphylococcus hyicus]MCQ9310782.1 hypothetical protein [Staphylococcus hyicus]
MTKVNLSKFETDKNGNILGVTNESFSYEIKPIVPRQFGALAKVFNETQKELQQNNDFKKTVQNLFVNFQDGMSLEDMFRSEDFNAFTILDAIGFLVENAPKRLAQIVAIASGLDERYLEVQDMDTYFEIIEGIIEVNDIEKVVKRIKKLQEKLGKAFAFMKTDDVNAMNQ